MRHVGHFVPAVADPDDVGEVVGDDPEVIGVISDVGGQEQRIATTDDSLLLRLGAFQ